MPDSRHSPEPLEMFRGVSSHMKAMENVLAAPGGLRSLQAPSFAWGFHLVEANTPEKKQIQRC